MVRWAARSRRICTIAVTHSPRAMTATAPAARATIPVVVVRSSTPPQDRPDARRLAGEQRGVGLLVVVGRLLARDRTDGDEDLHRRAGRRRLAERALDRRGLAGDGLVDRLLDLDRLARAGDLDGHRDVALVVLALVLELDREGGVAAGGDGGERPPPPQRGRAHVRRQQAVAVRAGGRGPRLARPAAARRAEPLADVG